MGKTEPQTMRAPEGMKRTIKASVFSDLFGDKKYRCSSTGHCTRRIRQLRRRT